jgi:hypothetical protein
MSSIFIINLIISLIATGLIWTIQLVHYPSMKFVPEERFISFHNFHSKRISILAIPIMLIELITSFVLFYQNINSYNHIFYYQPLNCNFDLDFYFFDSSPIA